MRDDYDPQGTREERAERIREAREEIRVASAVSRSASWRLLLVFFAVLAVLAATSIGVWMFKFQTSEVKGAGDQVRIVNDAKNRIRAQEHFYTLYNQIKAYDQQLDQAAADKAAHPNDNVWVSSYAGLVKTCIDARNEYNADTDKVTKAKWLDPELPYKIDNTDPETDCKETK